MPCEQRPTNNNDRAFPIPGKFVGDFTNESLDRFAVQDKPVAAHTVAADRSRQIADAGSMMFRAANSGGV